MQGGGRRFSGQVSHVSAVPGLENQSLLFPGPLPSSLGAVWAAPCPFCGGCLRREPVAGSELGKAGGAPDLKRAGDSGL